MLSLGRQGWTGLQMLCGGYEQKMLMRRKPTKMTLCIQLLDCGNRLQLYVLYPQPEFGTFVHIHLVSFPLPKPCALGSVKS